MARQVVSRLPDGPGWCSADNMRGSGALVCGGTAMPIRQYLGDNRSFSREDLDAMGRAFVAALARLGLNDRTDATVELVARRIITAALAGERNAIKLAEFGAGGSALH